MKETLSLTETARHLQVSEDFVAIMIQRGRLTPLPDKRFDTAEVEALAALLGRLRTSGIASMIEIAATTPDKLSD